MEEVAAETERPVVRKLFDMARLRNRHPAFHLEGECRTALDGSRLTITRAYQGAEATLEADLETHAVVIKHS